MLILKCLLVNLTIRQEDTMLEVINNMLNMCFFTMNESHSVFVMLMNFIYYSDSIKNPAFLI